VGPTDSTKPNTEDQENISSDGSLSDSDAEDNAGTSKCCGPRCTDSVLLSSVSAGRNLFLSDVVKI